MKTLTTIALAGSLVWLASGTATAQLTKTLEGQSATVTATIEAIEQATRQLTVKTDKGTYETIVAPPEMTKFSSLKVGDRITARYYENVVVRFKKPGEPAVDVDSEAVTLTKGRPGGTAAVQRTITATVTEIDPKVASITVKGPNGWTYSRKVVDKKALAQLKVGDRLDMTWTDALLISVDSAAK